MILSSTGSALAVAARRFQFVKCRLVGCYIVQFPAADDCRGSFVKTIQQSAFAAEGLEANFVEVFYTTSYRSVFRGMHFQTPPHDHAKLVYCTAGSIYDVALDLRVGSPTFGQHESYELSEELNTAVYLPRGVAHGFCVQEAPSVVVYHVTAEYSAEHDQGILWNSFGAEWPVHNPILSDRDRKFPPLSAYVSPFRYEAPESLSPEGEL